MRIASLLLTIAVLSLTACGSSRDPDPEKVKDMLVVIQGDVLDGEIRSDNHYPDLTRWDWEEDIDNLPAGFDYDTDDLFFDELDRVWVEYELAVAPWVTPGEYRFEVIYEFIDHESIFREEIEFRFRVNVLRDRSAHVVVFDAVRTLGPEEREAGADTDIVIGADE